MLPFINIFGIQIPMYGVCLVTGIAVAVIMAVLKCKRKGLEWENVFIISFVAIGLGLFGARVVFLLITYSPNELWRIFSTGNWSLIAKSGLVFYGGLIFGIIGAFFGAKIAGVRLLDYEHVLTPYLPLAHAFGRIGCLFAGCCYGKETDSIFSVVYETPLSDAPTNLPLIPVQLYEAALNLILFFWLSKRSKNKNSPLLATYLCAYAIIRFLIEFLRFDTVRGIWNGFSTSQWISIVMFAMGIFLLLVKTKRTSNK